MNLGFDAAQQFKIFISWNKDFAGSLKVSHLEFLSSFPRLNMEEGKFGNYDDVNSSM